MVNDLVAHANSRPDIEKAYNQAVGRWDKAVLTTSQESAQKAGLSHGLMIDGRIIGTGLWTDETAAAEQIARLNQLEGIPLSAAGDRYVHEDSRQQLIKIAAQAANPEVNFTFATAFEPPLPIIILLYEYFKSLGTLWQKAT
jgi:hypothetical protein